MELPKGHKKWKYDDWLDYFRKLPAADLNLLEAEGQKTLPSEGYAALKRWIDIFENPSKMDKLHQGRLKAEYDQNIMEIAIGEDDEAFYIALIRENVQQLNSSNISQQEVARLSQNINIFRKELREIRSRKPRAGTVLNEVLAEAKKRSEKTTKKTTKKATPKKASAKTTSKGSKTKKTTKTTSKKVSASKAKKKGNNGKARKSDTKN